MLTKTELTQALRDDPPAKRFVPYCHLSKDADVLTVYFEGDPDYSECLNDRVTLYRSLWTYELVGCRIDGFSDVIEALPNYIEDVTLSAVLLPFWGGCDRKGKQDLDTLAKCVNEHRLVLGRYL